LPTAIRMSIAHSVSRSIRGARIASRPDVRAGARPKGTIIIQIAKSRRTKKKKLGGSDVRQSISLAFQLTSPLGTLFSSESVTCEPLQPAAAVHCAQGAVSVASSSFFVSLLSLSLFVLNVRADDKDPLGKYEIPDPPNELGEIEPGVSHLDDEWHGTRLTHAHSLSLSLSLSVCVLSMCI
jgi:hypothetical protein